MPSRRKRCYTDFLDSNQYELEVATPPKILKTCYAPNLDDLSVCVRRVVEYIQRNVLRLPSEPYKFAQIVAKLSNYTTQLDPTVVFYQLLLNGLIVPLEGSNNLYLIAQKFRPYHELVIWVPAVPLSDAPENATKSYPVSEDFRKVFTACYEYITSKGHQIQEPFTAKQLITRLQPLCQVQHGCDANAVLAHLLQTEIIWLEESQDDHGPDGNSSHYIVRYNPKSFSIVSNTIPQFHHFDGVESSLSV